MAESDGTPAAEGCPKPRETPCLVDIEGMVTGEPRSGENLWDLLCRFATGISSPDGGAQTPLFRRVRSSFAKTAPHLREACGNTGRGLLLWSRQGSPLRALLLISVGTITLLGLTGLLVFMLFFLAATFNAIVVSFLFSLAAAGGFLAFFFTCLTAVYIGALLVAVFIISTATISTIIGILITTGWIGFLLTIWLFAKKSASLAKHSISMTGSALSAYSAAHRSRHQSKKEE